MATAVLALFIKPIHVDPRFGLGVGAVFAAIGNMIAVASFLSRAQQATLTDMVNILGLVTIFLTLVQSISLYQYDSMGPVRKNLTQYFDNSWSKFRAPAGGCTLPERISCAVTGFP